MLPITPVITQLNRNPPGPVDTRKRYDVAELELLVVMREALSIPEVDITLPGRLQLRGFGISGRDDDPASEASA